MYANHPSHDALLGIRSRRAQPECLTFGMHSAGGIKENVLPPSARAVINHRIIPGDTVTSVLEHDRSVINDPRVTVSLDDGYDLHMTTTIGVSYVKTNTLAWRPLLLVRF